MLPVTSSELSTEFAASSEEPTAPATIFAAVTEFTANLPSVTCPFPKCIVSILPVTNSALSTEFAAKDVVKATAAPPLKFTPEAVTSPVREKALVVAKVVAVSALPVNAPVTSP